MKAGVSKLKELCQKNHQRNLKISACRSFPDALWRPLWRRLLVALRQRRPPPTPPRRLPSFAETLLFPMSSVSPSSRRRAAFGRQTNGCSCQTCPAGCQEEKVPAVVPAGSARGPQSFSLPPSSNARGRVFVGGASPLENVAPVRPTLKSASKYLQSRRGSFPISSFSQHAHTDGGKKKDISQS